MDSAVRVGVRNRICCGLIGVGMSPYVKENRRIRAISIDAVTELSGAS
jgi:hypothetical protein